MEFVYHPAVELGLVTEVEFLDLILLRAKFALVRGSGVAQL